MSLFNRSGQRGRDHRILVLSCAFPQANRRKMTAIPCYPHVGVVKLVYLCRRSFDHICSRISCAPKDIYKYFALGNIGWNLLSFSCRYVRCCLLQPASLQLLGQQISVIGANIHAKFYCEITSLMWSHPSHRMRICIWLHVGSMMLRDNTLFTLR